MPNGILFLFGIPAVADLGWRVVVDVDMSQGHAGAAESDHARAVLFAFLRRRTGIAGVVSVVFGPLVADGGPRCDAVVVAVAITIEVKMLLLCKGWHGGFSVGYFLLCCLICFMDVRMILEGRNRKGRSSWDLSGLDMDGCANLILIRDAKGHFITLGIVAPSVLTYRRRVPGLGVRI